MYINISTFLTHVPFGSQEYYNYDLREPKRKIINPDKFKETKKTVVLTNDWTNIPYYPTTHERRENVAKYLISMGKEVPSTLLKQIEEDRKKANSEDAFNKLNNNISSNGEDNNINIIQRPPVQYQNFVQQSMRPNIPTNINKYSPQYAAYIGAKPRAQASVRVKLGGVY